ncbi:putative phage integrase [Burkholderia pseudomallei]|uniref:tyrosine-type recombinase/integrase n=1 Tax=Burkholderia pseudomallei TaxID=28450 RepID=UPI000F049A4B|nr:site-specific integrase [Burkholderia pseudomallei]CAJ4021087.1 putative phage integrase [Burkholderia pseudomallei]CAJ5378703.1 putative phage integrase [Burkholderia pseudomallei]CAJ5631695.1 putative phage integrase [Burkholderia pseudomallei]CAJ9353006.1 putative phage integrase [Burkholderia pseudomallei]CAK0497400.1 putative phage integrase [Burkholderia pseudomallei]
MRTLNRLTAVQVSRAKKRGVYSDGGGLYLQITRTLTKSWLFRYMRNGVSRGMGLGPIHTVSLAEARIKAQDVRRMLLDGIDPLEAKKAKRQAERRERLKSLPFRDCAHQYIDAHRKSWKNEKHAAQWGSTIETYANPVIGNVMVAEIDTDEIMRVLEPIWADKTETATRLRGRIESVLAWATVRGYRTGLNPARWKGHLDHLLPKPSRLRKTNHHAALPYTEAPTFMKTLQQHEGAAALALQLVILTASRTNEVIAARKSEFDLPAKIWTIPAERMKAGREHRVPLSATAVALVKPLIDTGTSKFLFPASKENKHLSNMAMLQLLKRMKREDLTVHGFRSTFKDWARETTDYAREVSEAALAHIIGDQTEAAYARGDLFLKRAGLMQDWADYLLATSVPTRAPAACLESA